VECLINRAEHIALGGVVQMKVIKAFVVAVLMIGFGCAHNQCPEARIYVISEDASGGWKCAWYWWFRWA
jgi:hypothetical protein